MESLCVCKELGYCSVQMQDISKLLWLISPEHVSSNLKLYENRLGGVKTAILCSSHSSHYYCYYWWCHSVFLSSYSLLVIAGTTGQNVKIAYIEILKKGSFPEKFSEEIMGLQGWNLRRIPGCDHTWWDEEEQDIKRSLWNHKKALLVASWPDQVSFGNSWFSWSFRDSLFEMLGMRENWKDFGSPCVALYLQIMGPKWARNFINSIIGFKIICKLRVQCPKNLNEPWKLKYTLKWKFCWRIIIWLNMTAILYCNHNISK